LFSSAEYTVVTVELDSALGCPLDHLSVQVKEPSKMYSERCAGHIVSIDQLSAAFVF